MFFVYAFIAPIGFMDSICAFNACIVQATKLIDDELYSLVPRLYQCIKGVVFGKSQTLSRHCSFQINCVPSLHVHFKCDLGILPSSYDPQGERGRTTQVLEPHSRAVLLEKTSTGRLGEDLHLKILTF